MAISKLTIPARTAASSTGYASDMNLVIAKINELATSRAMSPLTIAAAVGAGNPAADMNQVVAKINELINSTNVTPAVPTITSFTPTSGLAGSSITIAGTNFTGATAVSINSGAVAGFVVDSATQISATLTSSQATGKVRVTTPGGTAVSSTDFTVTSAGGGGNGPFNTGAVGTSLFTDYPVNDPTVPTPMERAYALMSHTTFPQPIQNAAIPNSRYDGLIYQLTNRMAYQAPMLLAVDNLINDIYFLVQQDGYQLANGLTELQNRLGQIRDEAVKHPEIVGFVVQTTARASTPGDSALSQKVYELSVAFSNWIRTSYTSFWPGLKVLVDLAKNKYMGLGSTEAGYILTKDGVHWPDQARQLVGGLYAQAFTLLASGNTNIILVGEPLVDNGSGGGGTTPPAHYDNPTEAQLAFGPMQYNQVAFDQGRYEVLANSAGSSHARALVQDGQINNVVQSKQFYKAVSDSIFVAEVVVTVEEITHKAFGLSTILGANSTSGTTLVQGKDGIDYGIYFDGAGALSLQQIGKQTVLSSEPAAVVGDVFRFRATKTQVLVYRNSNLLYTYNRAESGLLAFAVSQFAIGARVALKERYYDATETFA